ncbi:recombinase RecT [Gorillibacterium sp. sgz5001074]|uniref:recombinase RecT n=1 Tax=Gorillibacterium sp. sgz5001074 TaxID=3446695 RepID=UPI003F66DEAB
MTKQVDQSVLKNQLQTTNTAGQAPAVSPATQVAAYLKKMEGEIARALPKHLTPERLTRIALTTIRTNPKLLECTLPSLMAGVMQAAQLGLEPGLIGHCYFVPFKNTKQNTMEVQFIIGYKGMIDLARRSGNIESIAAHVVYDNDFIELEYGLEDKLRHVPWHLRTDKKMDKPGDIKGAYMVAKFKDGGHQIHYMPYAEIIQHRDRSSGYQNAKKWNRTDTPWLTDEPEMCKKTVVRAGWKWLPISIEIAKEVEKDEVVRQDVTDLNNDGVIDIGIGDVSYEDEPQAEPTKQDELEFNE